MRLRVCSLLLLFMALSIKGAVGAEEENPPHDPVKPISETGNSAEKTGEKPTDLKKKTKRSVLIYNPYIGFYHTKFMTTIARSLHESGDYDVTMLNILVNPEMDKLNKKLPKEISQFEVAQNEITAEIIKRGNESDEGLAAFWGELSLEAKLKGFFGYYVKSNNFSTMLEHQCRDTIESNAFRENIVKKNFDLAITEVFDLCGVGLFHLLENKPGRVILASSVPLHEHLGEMLGLPKSFDIVPTKFNVITSPSFREIFTEFSFGGLIGNSIESALWGRNMFGWLDELQTEIFVSKSEKFPGFKKLLRSAHSLIENVHPLLDLSKPTLNSIIPIGGITVDKDPSSVPDEILEKINTAKKAGKKIILVSFGTVMAPHLMTEKTMGNLIEAFKTVNDAFFLWKVNPELLSGYNIDEMKVFVKEWLPQNDLLASGKIDLFVSHMGIGSFTEAAYNGVPLVSIPIFVDQHYNYVCAKRLGIAHWVDKTSLSTSPEMLVATIEEALKADKTASRELSTFLKNSESQEKRMLDHIKLALELPPNFISMGFNNHHHGFNFILVLRSLGHLIPYHAVPLVVIAIFLMVPWNFVVLYRSLKGPKKEDAKRRRRREEEEEEEEQEEEEEDAENTEGLMNMKALVALYCILIGPLSFLIITIITLISWIPYIPHLSELITYCVKHSFIYIDYCRIFLFVFLYFVLCVFFYSVAACCIVYSSISSLCKCVRRRAPINTKEKPKAD